jgi:hypothetical protein
LSTSFIGGTIYVLPGYSIQEGALSWKARSPIFDRCRSGVTGKSLSQCLEFVSRTVATFERVTIRQRLQEDVSEKGNRYGLQPGPVSDD